MELPTAFRHELKIGTGLRARPARAATLALSPDGRLLAVGGESPTVDLWDPYEPKLLAQLAGHRPTKLVGTVQCLAFSPDGQLLASGGRDGTVRLWRANDGQCLDVLSGFSGPLAQLAFSQTAPILAAADEQSVRLFDLSVSPARPVTAHLPEPGVNALAFHPNGSVLAVALGGRERKGTHRIALIEPVGGQPVYALGEGDFLARSLAFSPDGGMLAAGMRGDEVRLWDPNGWQPIRSLKVPSYSAFALAFTAGGILGGATGDRVCMWDPATGELVASAKVPYVKNSSVANVVFSPDARLMVTCRTFAQVRVYGTSSGS
ncbi:WD40 repeat domain-containing protein [Actinospica robiniae]|uniref:WD40 repeat domain-containing protein n=1 Tax=Actinospica robiniae TaxID=304901 RepID=UPI00042697AB|nr:WD40 repeat domain-containing protein [Actinospica robiniae]